MWPREVRVRTLRSWPIIELCSPARSLPEWRSKAPRDGNLTDDLRASFRTRLSANQRKIVATRRIESENRTVPVTCARYSLNAIGRCLSIDRPVKTIDLIFQ